MSFRQYLDNELKIWMRCSVHDVVAHVRLSGPMAKPIQSINVIVLRLAIRHRQNHVDVGMKNRNCERSSLANTPHHSMNLSALHLALRRRTGM